ncbi:hypothetical protein [Burkholderia sp. MSMB1826]|uniref:hypothetical protein n=1 Tax=Burkholderia sp. MSMB1826 TaxID=1637875 RepID=UPI0012E354B9|nr:hypothetical protein [Burkholderia sp. MSMB1826]
MNTADIDKIKNEIFSMDQVEIINIADKILRRVTSFASALYNRIGRTIGFSWRDDAESTASTYHETSESDRVIFSYQFAIDIYRDARLLSRLARVHFCDPKYKQIFGTLSSDRLGVLPAGCSEEKCSQLMFEATLEWVFFHEMAHLSQGHIGIRDSFHPKKSVRVIEELRVGLITPLRGQAALISHVTEIAADHEGLVIWLQYRSVLNQNSIPYADVYMAICGMTCLFNRFYGSSSKDFNSKPEGSHPNSAMRWELLLTTFFGYFLDETVRDRFRDWQYSADELLKHLTEANALANLHWIMCHGKRGMDPLAFISVAKLDNPATRKYLRHIVPTLQNDPEPELVPVGSGDFRLVTLNQN